jgi:hypothetical protein
VMSVGEYQLFGAALLLGVDHMANHFKVESDDRVFREVNLECSERSRKKYADG